MGTPEIEAFLTHLEQGYGATLLPNAADRKHPNADAPRSVEDHRQWIWPYAFPASTRLNPL